MTTQSTQFEFDEAFAGIGYEQAIALLLGDQKPNDQQQDVLDRSTIDGGPTFVPLPVDHLGFQVRCEPGFWGTNRLTLVPGTQLIRRRINQLRRNDLSATLKISQQDADFLFTEVNGWQQAVDSVIEMYEIFKNDPCINDIVLRRDHNISFQKDAQRRAIRALRAMFRTNASRTA